MAQVSSLIVERFKRLPRVSTETWQGGLVRLPTWVNEGPEGKPLRPWAGMWVSRMTGLVHLKLPTEPCEPDWSLALETLLEFGTKSNLAGCRPACLEVREEVLGARIREALGDDDLTVRVTPDLPAVRALLDELRRDRAEGPHPPAALDVPGVTVERLRAFAGAAKQFYKAAPWRYLSDEDLIAVEAPQVEAGLRHLTLLGAGGQVYGIGFFHSAEDHASLMSGLSPKEFPEGPPWSVLFGPMWELPIGDADLWEDHALPVAGEEAYPVAMRIASDGTMHRPDAGTLAYLEGLLRVLAETAEEEIDTGRWIRQGHTSDGPVSYQLCIPSLLAPLDAPEAKPAAGFFDRRAMERMTAEIERFVSGSQFESLEEVNEALRREFSGPLGTRPSTASTLLEQAQDLAYRAFEARGRRRIQLARKALECSPDCADAYVILAEGTQDLECARDLYAQGVAAGERALGPQIFNEHAGHFWHMVSTRPYMRARFGMAQCLEHLGVLDEAIMHYQEILRLNPGDNQGVRCALLPALLLAGRDEEAGILLRQFEEDILAIWQYGRALWTFRREGDSPTARDQLHRALKANRQAATYLAKQASLPANESTSYALGSEEEAIICAHTLAGAWINTPGAQAWLAAQGKGKKSKAPKRRPRRR